MAFAGYNSSRLENQPLPSATPTFSPLLALTRGIAALLPTSAAAAAAGASKGKSQLALRHACPLASGGRSLATHCVALNASPADSLCLCLYPVPAGAPASSAAAQLTLPDGRLHVGTHLPLLAHRYRYLSSLGEGVSAQVGDGTRTRRRGMLCSLTAG